MSVSATLNSVTHTLPTTDETGWGSSVTAFLQAVASSTLQKSGGTFTLTAEADFGATYGVLAAYFKTRTVEPATSGVVRLARADKVSWSNAAHDADLPLGPGSDNLLEFNSIDLVDVSTTQTLTNKTVSPTAWTALTYSNSWVNFGSTNSTAGYRKLPDGNVQLRGSIKSGTTTDSTTAFTLPANYRPLGRAVFAVKGSTSGTFEIGTDGAVKVYTLSNATELSLEGIVFATT